MRISDWSSDVCSSDLRDEQRPGKGHSGTEEERATAKPDQPAGANDIFDEHREVRHRYERRSIFPGGEQVRRLDHPSADHGPRRQSVTAAAAKPAVDRKRAG